MIAWPVCFGTFFPSAPSANKRVVRFYMKCSHLAMIGNHWQVVQRLPIVDPKMLILTLSFYFTNTGVLLYSVKYLLVCIFRRELYTESKITQDNIYSCVQQDRSTLQDKIPRSHFKDSLTYHLLTRGTKHQSTAFKEYIHSSCYEYSFKTIIYPIHSKQKSPQAKHCSNTEHLATDSITQTWWRRWNFFSSTTFFWRAPDPGPGVMME